MKRIYIGFSMSGDFDLLAQQFDLDGEFETVLAQDYLPDGRSEIYIKNAEVSGFKDFDELISFFPFHVDKKVLEEKIDIEKVNSVFWVNYEKDLKNFVSKNLHIVYDFYIDKFSYEE